MTTRAYKITSGDAEGETALISVLLTAVKNERHSFPNAHILVGCKTTHDEDNLGDAYDSGFRNGANDLRLPGECISAANSAAFMAGFNNGQAARAAGADGGLRD